MGKLVEQINKFRGTLGKSACKGEQDMRAKGLEEQLNNIKDTILNLNSELNEEQTKHSLVLPFFIALGYNVFDMSEFIPEYTADFGIKQGEKVDYAIVVNGQPLAIIEVKKVGKQLSPENVSQLFRYHSATDARFAILTNGKEYWFFTDSRKTNKMDSDPYLKVDISRFTENDVEELLKYTRGNIENIDVGQDIAEIRLKSITKELMYKLINGDIPRDFIDWVSDKSEVDTIDKARSAVLIKSAIDEVLNKGSKGNKGSKEKAGIASKDTKDTNKVERSKSNISLGLEYRYNDYSDGDWQFHKPEYIVLDGNNIEINSFTSILIIVVKWVLDNGRLTEDDLLEVRALKWNESVEGLRAGKVIEGYNHYIETSFGSSSIVSIINKLFIMGGIEDNALRIKFES